MILLNKFITCAAYRLPNDPYNNKWFLVLINCVNRSVNLCNYLFERNATFRYVKNIKNHYLSFHQECFYIMDKYNRGLLTFNYYNKSIYMRLDGFYKVEIDFTSYYVIHMNFKNHVENFISNYKKVVLNKGYKD